MARELKRFELGDLVMDFGNKFSWTVINEIRKNISVRRATQFNGGVLCERARHLRVRRMSL